MTDSILITHVIGCLFYITIRRNFLHRILTLFYYSSFTRIFVIDCMLYALILTPI